MEYPTVVFLTFHYACFVCVFLLCILKPNYLRLYLEAYGVHEENLLGTRYLTEQSYRGSTVVH